MDQNTSFDKRRHQFQKTAILVKVTCAFDLFHKFSERIHHWIGGAAEIGVFCCVQGYASSSVNSSGSTAAFLSRRLVPYLWNSRALSPTAQLRDFRLRRRRAA